MNKTYSIKQYVAFTFLFSCGMSIAVLGSIIFTGLMTIALIMIGWPNDHVWIIPTLYLVAVVCSGFAAWHFSSEDAFRSNF